MTVVTPIAAVDLEDAVVSGSIGVVVGGLGVVVRLPLAQTDPCRGDRTDPDIDHLKGQLWSSEPMR